MPARAPTRSFATAADLGEHRIGLKPILRRVRAPRGERPVARDHQRFELLYVTAFVSPATEESVWYLATGVDKALFEDTLALFARETGAGRDRIVILVLDGAGWHTAPLRSPRTSASSACCPRIKSGTGSPLQSGPPKRYWSTSTNRSSRHFGRFTHLATVVAERFVALGKDRRLVSGQAGFHW